LSIGLSHRYRISLFVLCVREFGIETDNLPS
jgi:hypothetical protein